MQSRVVVVLVGAILLSSYHGIHATQKYVLGIDARNRTLFLNDGSSKRGTTTTTNSTVLNSTPATDAPVPAKAVHASEWKEPDPTNWSAIEKKLDADLSSAANIRRWTEKTNSISYNNPRKMNRSSHERVMISKNATSQVNVTTNVTNPLLARLIDEENVLGETEKLIARMLAEKTYTKLSDMVATRFDDNNNAVARNKESGTVSRALDELSSSILADCKRLFGMMFGRGGEAMTSNENCLRLVGRSVASNLEKVGGFEAGGEGMSYDQVKKKNSTTQLDEKATDDLKKNAVNGTVNLDEKLTPKVNNTVKLNDKATHNNNDLNTDKVNTTVEFSEKTSQKEGGAEKKELPIPTTIEEEVIEGPITGLAAAAINNITAGSIENLKPVMNETDDNEPPPIKLTKGAKVSESDSDASPSALADSASSSLSNAVINATTASVTNDKTNASATMPLVNGNITSSATSPDVASEDASDQVATIIQTTDNPSAVVNESIASIDNLLHDLPDDISDGVAAATALLKSEANGTIPGGPEASNLNEESKNGTIVEAPESSNLNGTIFIQIPDSSTLKENVTSLDTPEGIPESDPENVANETNLTPPAVNATLISTSVQNNIPTNLSYADTSDTPVAFVVPETNPLNETVVALPANSTAVNQDTSVDAGDKVMNTSGSSIIYGNITVTDLLPQSSVIHENNTNIVLNQTIAYAENTTEDVAEAQEAPSDSVAPVAPIPLNATEQTAAPVANAAEAVPAVTEASLVPPATLNPTNMTTPLSDTAVYPSNLTRWISMQGLAGALPSTNNIESTLGEAAPAAANMTTPVDSPAAPAAPAAGFAPINATTPSDKTTELPPDGFSASIDTSGMTGLAPVNVTPPATAGGESAQPDALTLVATTGLLPQNVTAGDNGLTSASFMAPVVTTGVAPANTTASDVGATALTPPSDAATGINNAAVAENTTIPEAPAASVANSTVPDSPVLAAPPVETVPVNATSPSVDTNNQLNDIPVVPVTTTEPVTEVSPPVDSAPLAPSNTTASIANMEISSVNNTVVNGLSPANATPVDTQSANFVNISAPLDNQGANIASNATMLPDSDNLEPTYGNVTSYPLYSVVTDNVTNATLPTNFNNASLPLINVLPDNQTPAAPLPPPPAPSTPALPNETSPEVSPANDALPASSPANATLPVPLPENTEPAAPQPGNDTPPAPPPEYVPSAFTPLTNPPIANDPYASGPLVPLTNVQNDMSALQTNTTDSAGSINTTNTANNTLTEQHVNTEDAIVSTYTNETTQQQQQNIYYNNTTTTTNNNTQQQLSEAPSVAQNFIPPLGLDTSSPKIHEFISPLGLETSETSSKVRDFIPPLGMETSPKSLVKGYKRRKRFRIPRGHGKSHNRHSHGARFTVERRSVPARIPKNRLRHASRRSERANPASRIRTKRSKPLRTPFPRRQRKDVEPRTNAHHHTRCALKKHHIAGATTRCGSKRRLVSNHVPHTKDKKQEFKVLSEEKHDQNKTKPAAKTDPATAAPQENNTSKPSEDAKPDIANNLLAGAGDKDGAHVRPTLTPMAMPTISQNGINVTKNSVLQNKVANKEQTNVPATVKAGESDESKSYATDDRFPHLGLLPHAKAHEGISNDESHDEDPALRHFPMDKDTPPSSNLENLNAPKPKSVAPPATDANTDAPPEKEVPTKRILCFGDSMTKGGYAGDRIHHPYTVKLRQLFKENKKGVNYHIINHGMTGDCVSRKMKRRLSDDLDNLPPLDLVVLLAGTEDLMHEDCAHDVELFQHIRTLHEMVHEKGYKSIVVTIPESQVYANGTARMTLAEYKDAIEDVNQKLRMYAATEKLPICDLADEFPRYAMPGESRNLADMWDDSIHPNALGYDRIGQILYSDIYKYV